MPEPSHAVFLSYASQDAEAAQKICDALRTADIEVWFDKSELRGGDAWDRQIRQQIHECRLFMPVVSANTEARVEGYFRREWKLAVDRTHDLSERIAFLVPIVIDSTSEAKADVPDAFRHVQWTRLPNGETPRSFTARILGLLRASGAAASTVGSAQTGTTTTSVVLPAATAKLTQRSGRAVMALVGVVAVVLLYVFIDRIWLSNHQSAERPAAAVAPPPTPSTAAIPEKSVAVLPFVNISDDKNNEYFSDGLSEELIDMLAKIPDLRVPARTSSFFFKGKQTTILEIAKALGVAHVLEGSVRKSGNTIRITAQLVRVDNGYHLWSETYDRQLDDIFKIQDEIASAVVKALKVSLLEGETARATPTTNTEAYTLYLQAQSIYNNALQSADVQRAIEHLQRALNLDPKFARAWAALAAYRVFDYGFYTAGNYQQVVADARYAAEQAVKLDPQLPEAHLALSDVYGLEWNWNAAEAEIKQALALDPGNADAFGYAVGIELCQSRFDEALQLAKKAIVLDPLSASNYGAFSGLGGAYLGSGRLVEAEAAYRQVLDLAPTMSQGHFLLGWVLLARHEPTAALAEMEQETDERYRDIGRALALDALGRRSEADRALAVAEAKYAGVVEYPIAALYANRNELDRAFVSLGRAYEVHDGWMIWFPWDPLLKNLRGDPRYAAFLRKMNLPE